MSQSFFNIEPLNALKKETNNIETKSFLKKIFTVYEKIDSILYSDIKHLKKKLEKIDAELKQDLEKYKFLITKNEKERTTSEKINNEVLLMSNKINKLIRKN
jgi:hypothetical protein